MDPLNRRSINHLMEVGPNTMDQGKTGVVSVNKQLLTLF